MSGTYKTTSLCPRCTTPAMCEAEDCRWGWAAETGYAVNPDRNQTTTHDHLWQCNNAAEQLTWAIAHLLKGGRLTDAHLWLGGVECPVRTVGKAKTELRRRGIAVKSAMEPVLDAVGTAHQMIAWRVDATNRVERDVQNDAA